MPNINWMSFVLGAAAVYVVKYIMAMMAARG